MHLAAWNCPIRGQRAPGAARILPAEKGPPVGDWGQNLGPREVYDTVGTSFYLHV